MNKYITIVMEVNLKGQEIQAEGQNIEPKKKGDCNNDVTPKLTDIFPFRYLQG